MGDRRLNQPLYDKYPEFREQMADIRAKNPLASSLGYFIYPTLDLVPKILSILDMHGIDLLPHIQGKAVADVGCGDGDLSFFLEQFQPKTITAFDWGPTNYNGMAACSVLKKVLGSSVQFVNSDIHALDFSALPVFDTVFCLGFLYHSPHPLLILQNLAKRCRNLFLSTRVFEQSQSYAYFYDEYECNNDPSNWWCYSPKALRLMLKRAGFEVTLMERLDKIQLLGAPAPLAALIRRVLFGRAHPAAMRNRASAFVYAKSLAF